MSTKAVVKMNTKELQEECRVRGLSAEETATNPELMTRIILFDSGQGTTDLPAPGYKRADELARRTDELEERIETEAPEVYPIDPKAFKEDREILHELDRDMLEVSNPDPEFMYCWVYFGQNAQAVWAKKSHGWRVVGVGAEAARDKECAEHKEVDGSRKIGDVLLMKTPRANYEKITAAQERRRAAQELGVSSNVLALADKYGLKVHEDISTVQLGPQTLMEVAQKRAGAEKVAMRHLDRKLRKGEIPGVPAPGK